MRAALDAHARGGAGRRPTSIPPMLDAVRAEATLGEICDLLRAEWGEHVEPARL